MSNYAKHNFADGNVLTASQLNEMDEAISTSNWKLAQDVTITDASSKILIEIPENNFKELLIEYRLILSKTNSDSGYLWIAPAKADGSTSGMAANHNCFYRGGTFTSTYVTGVCHTTLGQSLQYSESTYIASNTAWSSTGCGYTVKTWMNQGALTYAPSTGKIFLSISADTFASGSRVVVQYK